MQNPTEHDSPPCPGTGNTGGSKRGASYRRGRALNGPAPAFALQATECS